MEILKSTLKTYDKEHRVVIIDFLRDSKMLSVDQAAKLNTFHQKIKSWSKANTGLSFEKVQKIEHKYKHVRKIKHVRSY